MYPVTTARIAVLGDAFVDVVAANVTNLPTWAQSELCESMSMHTGGSSGNTVSHIAQFVQSLKSAQPGLRQPFYITNVGEDEFGKFFKAKLAARGVDIEGVISHSDVSTGACVVLSKGNGRTFMSSLGANQVADPTTRFYRSEKIWKTLTEECKLLHIANYLGLPNLQTESFSKFVQDLRAKGLVISLDPQSSNTDEWWGKNDMLRTLLPHIDILMLNEDEAYNIATTGSSSVHDPRHTQHEHHKDFENYYAAQVLCSYLPKDALVVITKASHGADAYRNSQLVARCGTLPVQKVVDATGGGDAFKAAFLMHHLYAREKCRTMQDVDETLHDSLALGCSCGAYRVTVLSGSENCPSWSLICEGATTIRALDAQRQANQQALKTTPLTFNLQQVGKSFL